MKSRIHDLLKDLSYSPTSKVMWTRGNGTYDPLLKMDGYFAIREDIPRTEKVKIIEATANWIMEAIREKLEREK